MQALRVLVLVAVIGVLAPAASASTLRSLQARWSGPQVIVHIRVCDGTGARVTIDVTEWNSRGSMSRTQERHRSWLLPEAAGCRRFDRIWTPAIPVGAMHTVDVRVREGNRWNATAQVSRSGP